MIELNETPAALHSPYPGIELLCAACHRTVGGLVCSDCGFTMDVEDGIVHALPPHRQAHFSKFVQDYEHIRAEEGRGAQDERYYLALPHQDTTNRNSKQWKIRARSFDYLVKHVLPAVIRCGRILDLGAGNCWMSFRLAKIGFRPVAVDLLVNAADGLSAAGHFEKHLAFRIPRFRAELANLPFADSQFDAVIFNASLHYAEDYKATLREALRCLQPGGLLIISDTPWYAREASGLQMVAERKAHFQSRYNTASDSIRSQEFLTDERLESLEAALSVEWTAHRPWYGLRWALRPWEAKLRKRRAPSAFRIYVARKDGNAASG